MFFLFNLSEFKPVSTSINTLHENIICWDYLTTLVIRKEKRIRKRQIMAPERLEDDVETVVVTERRLGRRFNSCYRAH